MKLSIITPVYRESKQLEKFLERMKKQSSKNFELVIIIDTNTEDILSLIDALPATFKKKVKLVFNSKRSTRAEAIDKGIKVATGDYSIIMSLSNTFNNDMVAKINAIIKTKKSDVIEFNAKFKDPIKFSGKIRKTYTKPVQISEHKEILAYSYPFDFNKIIKTTVLKESTKYEFSTKVNSRFSIEHVYKVLLIAKTYSTVSKKIISSKSKMSANFNPLKMIRQWDNMITIISNNWSNLSTMEFVYAQYFTEAFFMAAMVKSSKNKILQKKFNDKFKKQLQTKFKNIFDANIYASAQNKEATILKEYKGVSNLHKIIKELG